LLGLLGVRIEPISIRDYGDLETSGTKESILHFVGLEFGEMIIIRYGDKALI
jgi:hypothetical protein